MTSASSSDLVGRLLKGTYRIDSFLGEGGPSIVYRGTDILLGMPVAIKRLKTAALSQEHASMAERFLREARTQSRLVHQNIVGIRALLEDEGDHFIVMEFIDGPTLEHWLETLPAHQAPLDLILPLFSQILAGLGHAHQNEVIHRDIKPSNILIGKPFVAKIADFGIAHAVQDHRLTKTGAMLGTLLYMSPEQIRGEEITHRCDIYSLGLTLYEVIAGHHPFCRADEEISGYEVMSRHLFETAPPLSTFRSDLPPSLDMILQRSIAKHPHERLESCDEFAFLLEESLAPVSPTFRRPPSSSMMIFNPSASPRPDSSAGIVLSDDLREPLPTPTPAFHGRQTASALPRSGALTPPPASSSSHRLPPSASSSPHPTPPSASSPASTLTSPPLPSEESIPQPSAALHLSPRTSPSFLASVVIFSAILWSFGLSFLFLWHRFFRFPAAPPQRLSPTPHGQASPSDRPSLRPEPLATALSKRPTPPHPQPSPSLPPSPPLQPPSTPSPPTPLPPNVAPPLQPPPHVPPPPTHAPHLATSPLDRPNPPALQQEIAGMIRIPGGPFTQGQGRFGEKVKRWYKTKGDFLGLGSAKYPIQVNDAPERLVSVDTFWIDRFEVSVGAYKRCLAAKACNDIPISSENDDGQKVPLLESLPLDDIPLHYATWDDAAAFCRWAGKRLPTEKEWEKAARGDRGQPPYPWGTQAPTCDRSIHRGCTKGLPQRSGRKTYLDTASPYGVRDLSGNLWEWVADCYRADSYLHPDAPASANPSCPKRILRGGSFQTPRDSPGITVFYRRPESPSLRKADIGFRCASKTPPQR